MSCRFQADADIGTGHDDCLIGESLGWVRELGELRAKEA